MNKQNYSLVVTIIRIIAGVFGLIAFALMFTHQLDAIGGSHYAFNEIAFGTNLFGGVKSTPVPFIGYILIALGAVMSLAMIFLKNVLGNAKTCKLVDFIIAGLLIIGGVLVVMTEFWFWLPNQFEVDTLSISGGPIAAVVFAALAGGLNIFAGIVEEKI